MKALLSVRNRVGRTRGWLSRASDVDKQLAALVKTIEAENQALTARESVAALEEPRPALVRMPAWAHLPRPAGPTVREPAARRLRLRWREIRPDIAFIVVAAVFGVLIGALFGYLA